MHLFRKYSAKKLTNLEDAAVTAVNSVLQQADRDVWVGSTVVASRYGCRVQGTTQVAFTVLDVLGYLDEIPVCVGYEVDGEVIRDFPTTNKLERAKPVLKVLPGWKTDIRGIKKYEDLPENCRKYIEFVEKELEVPIKIVSNGPSREDIILK